MTETLRNPETTTTWEEIAQRRRAGVLLHGYTLSERGEKTDLSLRSGIVARAGAVEHRSRRSLGEKTTLFVNLGHLWGEGEPTEGSLFRDRLTKRYHIPEEDVVVREDAQSTGGEVASFVEEARKNGWANLTDVAFAKHHSFISILRRKLGTIPLIYKGFGVKPEFKSAEDILREKDIHRINRAYKVRKVLDVDKDGNPKPWREVPIAERQYVETGEEIQFVHAHNHAANLVNKLTGPLSMFERVYQLYEGIKWGIMHKPGFNYDTLEKANKDSRVEKVPDSPLSKKFGRRFDFDVYTLNGVKSPFARKK